jgi:hypothetical protein
VREKKIETISSASGLFDCFHEEGEMSRVEPEKGGLYSFTDGMMGFITQYQSFLKLRLFSRFLYQIYYCCCTWWVGDIKTRSIPQCYSYVCGSEEESNTMCHISTWDGRMEIYSDKECDRYGRDPFKTSAGNLAD